MKKFRVRWTNGNISLLTGFNTVNALSSNGIDTDKDVVDMVEVPMNYELPDKKMDILSPIFIKKYILHEVSEILEDISIEDTETRNRFIKGRVSNIKLILESLALK